MIVVADSGSTKADWVVVDGSRRQSLSTMGFNPIYHSSEKVASVVQAAFDAQSIPRDQVTAVYYYGTAIWDEEKAGVIAKALQSVFTQAMVDVEHDLLGAARATCKYKPGIACIIGTGSNTCQYDGKRIVDNVTNLGYFVGDEGSGAHLGKELVKAYFYRELPLALRKELEKIVPGGKTELLDNIYGKPSPNVYLATFTRFLGEHRDHFFIQKIVYGCFAEFIDRHVRKYSGHMEQPVHFIGSVAFHFRDILEVVLEERGLTCGIFIQKPIDDLVSYHTSDPSMQQ